MEITINTIRMQDDHAKMFEDYCQLNGLTRTAAARMLILKALRQELAVLEKLRENGEA